MTLSYKIQNKNIGINIGIGMQKQVLALIRVLLKNNANLLIISNLPNVLSYFIVGFFQYQSSAF